MGNSNQPFNPRNSQNMQVQTDHSYINVYQEEYFAAYQKLRIHPNFFTQFLHESPNFGKNLRFLFPRGLQSPEQYIEMVMYLRKYDPVITSSKQAQQNCAQSTLLDRFFMICLGNLTFQKYKSTKLSKVQVQNLLLDYYRLFVKQPKNCSLAKILKFISIEDLSNPEEYISVRRLAQKLRQFFPHVQKYLKDYYYAKFHDAREDFRILKYFNSQILNEDAVLLALRIPELERPQITELYNSDVYGTCFYTMMKRIVGYTGPWLMLVKHSQKNMQGHKETYIFGTYQSGPVRDSSGYQGDLNGFMFTLQPHIRFMTTGRGDQGQNFFLISSGNQLLTKHRNGLGFGGNSDMKNFKLWIDENIDNSTVYNGHDMTYGSGHLAGPLTERLRIERIEIWGLGTEANLRDQEQYWAERSAEITKIRKVNRKEFLNESKLFLQNVYSYQDEVGQVQRLEKKHSPIKSRSFNIQGKQNQNNFTAKENQHVSFKGNQQEHVLSRSQHYVHK